MLDVLGDRGLVNFVHHRQWKQSRTSSRAALFLRLGDPDEIQALHRPIQPRNEPRTLVIVVDRTEPNVQGGSGAADAPKTKRNAPTVIGAKRKAKSRSLYLGCPRWKH